MSTYVDRRSVLIVWSGGTPSLVQLFNDKRDAQAAAFELVCEGTLIDDIHLFYNLEVQN